MGCIGSLVSSSAADALSGTGGVFATDEDPELIADAVPFALKTMEAVLVSEPEHKGLLTALASGFVQYGYAFVSEEADRIKEDEPERAEQMQQRAKRLYMRAQRYAMRGLSTKHERFEASLKEDPKALMAKMEAEDVPLLYWAAASWALVISASLDDPEAIANFPTVRILAERAMALDEGWNEGTLHEFFITFEASAPDGDPKKAKAHFEKALEYSKGSKVGPYVSLAESVMVKEQNARSFHRLLNKALSIDLEKYPQNRLANTVLRRRAKRLKAASEDLFLEDIDEEVSTSSTSGV